VHLYSIAGQLATECIPARADSRTATLHRSQKHLETYFAGNALNLDHFPPQLQLGCFLWSWLRRLGFWRREKKAHFSTKCARDSWSRSSSVAFVTHLRCDLFTDWPIQMQNTQARSEWPCLKSRIEMTSMRHRRQPQFQSVLCIEYTGNRLPIHSCSLVGWRRSEVSANKLPFNAICRTTSLISNTRSSPAP